MAVPSSGGRVWLSFSISLIILLKFDSMHFSECQFYENLKRIDGRRPVYNDFFLFIQENGFPSSTQSA